MRRYQNLNQPLNHLPEELSTISILCSFCGHKYPPNWHEKRDSPLIPIKPNNYEGPGRWVPLAVSVKCPRCHELNSIDIPQKKLVYTVELYGDEAYRSFDGKEYIGFSLVGHDPKLKHEVEDKLLEFKQKWFPERDPKSWTIHMLEIWPGHKRAKSIFKDFKFADVQEFVAEFFELVKSLNNTVWIYSGSYMFKKPRNFNEKVITERKIELYTLAILKIINDLTELESRPTFIFDSEKVGQSTSIVHEWAERAFSGMQHSLIYTFATKSNEIDWPIYVKPGSHPSLEIADFVSYVTARYVMKKALREPIDLNPEGLGRVTYMGLQDGKDFVFHSADQFPWALFNE
ncbi:MAG: hypothetical protein INR69_17430 [Mucilaginibacter polytrichastri]|nr:hypothetical protein [Mucilaginibacter polytrichastri]